SLERRSAWIAARGAFLGDAYRERAALAARIALPRAARAIRERFDTYDRRLALLEQDSYPAPVRAARHALLAWEVHEADTAPREAPHRISAPLTVTVLAAPVPRPPLHPTLEDGRLREPVWDFDAAGLHA